jgi:hypothetical protein
MVRPKKCLCSLVVAFVPISPPSGELTLADKIVSTAWRLRRIVQVEAALYDNNETIERTFAGFNGNTMNRISRHEAQLERALYRAMHELERLQHKRVGRYVRHPKS